LPYKVLLHPKAAKALQKLDDTNKARIKKALIELAGDPYEMGEPLNPSDFWKIRIGDYRAIYEIDSTKKEVVILFVGHRKNVYDEFSKIL
jgi:mRNA interferase RelE/StbE